MQAQELDPALVRPPAVGPGRTKRPGRVAWESDATGRGRTGGTTTTAGEVVRDAVPLTASSADAPIRFVPAVARATRPRSRAECGCTPPGTPGTAGARRPGRRAGARRGSARRSPREARGGGRGRAPHGDERRDGDCPEAVGGVGREAPRPTSRTLRPLRYGLCSAASSQPSMVPSFQMRGAKHQRLTATRKSRTESACRAVHIQLRNTSWRKRSPRHQVPLSTRLRTRPGCASVSSCAMAPPIEEPTTCGCSRPSASMSAIVSRAKSAIAYGPSGVADRPTPRLSNVVRR